MTYAEAVRHIALKAVGFDPDAPPPPPVVVDDPYIAPPPSEHDKAVAAVRTRGVTLDDVRNAEREVQAALEAVATVARELFSNSVWIDVSARLEPTKAALAHLEAWRAQLRVLEEART